MSDKTELKPCPFCGGAARIESNRDWHRLYAAHDDDCALDADEADLMFPAQPGYLIEIAEIWNRRATIQSTAAEPVAYRFPKAGEGNGYYYRDSIDGEEDRFKRAWEPVYAAPVAPADAVRDAERWRFMMRVADNDKGPEAKAMGHFGNEPMEDDRLESDQMNDLIDRAIASLNTTPKEPAK